MMKKGIKKSTYMILIALAFVLAAAGAVILGIGFSKKAEADTNRTALNLPGSVVENALSSSKAKLSQAEYEALVEADYKESGGMVRFGNYRKRFDVNKTTYFIGTWLIELDGMNETYYRQATLSKTQRKQNIGFYKSEIHENRSVGDGEDVWGELAGASLSSLTKGEVLKEEALDGYWISHVVNADGVHDPKSGDLIDPDLDSLYDLLNLPELLPLKKKYDEIEDKEIKTEDEKQHNYYTRNLLVSTDGDLSEQDKLSFAPYEKYGRNDITDRCDIEIKALMPYNERLKAASEDARAEVILDLYARDDVKRHVEVYKFLCMDVNGNPAALSKINEMLRSKAAEQGATFLADEEYVQAVAESLENCKKTYYALLSSLLSSNGTVIADYRYSWSTEILDMAYEGKLGDESDTRADYISAANSIGAGNQDNVELEKAVLETSFLPEGIKRFEGKVICPVSPDYTKALKEEKSEAVLNDILAEQYNDAVKQMLELEFMVTAETSRIEVEAGARLLQEHIIMAKLWKTMVYDDPYGPLAEAVIDKYIDWLMKKYKELTGEDYEDPDPDDDLDDLDDGDPETGRMIEILKGETRDGGKGDKGQSFKDKGGELADDFMDRIGGLDNDGLLKELGKLVGDDLGDGNFGSLEGLARLAGDLGKKKDDLGDLLGTGNGGNSDDFGKGKFGGDIDDMLNKGLKDGSDRSGDRDNENYGDNYDGRDGNGGDDSKPWGDNKGLLDKLGADDANEYDFSDDMLASLLASILGTDFSNLPDNMKAAAIVAIHRYGLRHNAVNCLAYARKLLNQIISEKNPLCYAQYDGDVTAEYISFGSIDYSQEYTGYRFVEEDGEKTLARTATTSSYTFGDSRVNLSDGSIKDLKNPLGYQTDYYISVGRKTFPYLSEDDARTLLDENAEYITETDWGITVTAQMEIETVRIIGELERIAESD